MSTPVHLVDLKTGKPIMIESYPIGNDELRVLPVFDPYGLYGLFQAKSYSAGETQILATPWADGCIELTDLVLAFEKKNGVTVTVRFYDGTNTSTIFVGTLTDSPINLAFSPKGRFKGWKNAYIQGIASGAAVGTITLGYVRHNKSFTLGYTDWVLQQ